MQKGIAIFASGGGSNAEKLIEHFHNHAKGKINLIVSNKPNAYVLQRATKHGIPSAVIDKSIFNSEKELNTILTEHHIDFIVLAGFLWLIPSFLVKGFPKRIVNIHPALLPKYGGKGMYGSRVHQAVFDNNERESGMTIHYVDAQYDEGHIIHQSTVELTSTDTPDIIASKVLALEHLHYGKVVESLL